MQTVPHSDCEREPALVLKLKHKPHPGMRKDRRPIGIIRALAFSESRHDLRCRFAPFHLTLRGSPIEYQYQDFIPGFIQEKSVPPWD